MSTSSTIAHKFYCWRESWTAYGFTIHAHIWSCSPGWHRRRNYDVLVFLHFEKTLRTNLSCWFDRGGRILISGVAASGVDWCGEGSEGEDRGEHCCFWWFWWCVLLGIVVWIGMNRWRELCGVCCCDEVWLSEVRIVCIICTYTIAGI